MFIDIITEWRSISEAGGYPLTKVPSHQLRAAADVMGSDQAKAPEILAKALAKKAMRQQGMGPVSRGVALIRRDPGKSVSSVEDMDEFECSGEPARQQPRKPLKLKGSGKDWAKYYGDDESPSYTPSRLAKRPLPRR